MPWIKLKGLRVNNNVFNDQTKMEENNQKCVLITGSSKGIGRALAIVFSQKGYDIILHGRNQEDLERVREEVLKHGGGCEVVVGDLRAEETLDKLTEIAEKRNIFILINNAAINYDKSFSDFTSEELDEILNINLIAPVKLTKKVFHIFKNKHSGIIININGMEGLRTISDQRTGYATSKYGLRGFTDSLRFESKKHGIWVKGVYLSGVKTKMYEQTGKESSNCMNPLEVAEIIHSICKDYPSATIDEIIIGRKKY